MTKTPHVRICFMALILGCALWPARSQAQSVSDFLRSRYASSSSSRSSSSSSVGGRPAPRADGKSPMTGNAFFQEDPETGSLIVITDDETNEQIQKLVQDLDRPTPQCLIKVLFLEITHNDDLDIGSEFSFIPKGTGTLAAPGTGDFRGASSIFDIGSDLASKNQGGYYKIVEDDLQLTIKALSSVGKVEVLSRPSIVARNNQPAVITVGQRVPFIVNSQITQDGRTINTINYDDIGIILRVTPRIESEEMVELDVNPEISALTNSTVQISENLTAPVYDMRSALTKVVVPTGKTVVIGGLIQDRTVDVIRKIPFMGDIPYLGVLFSRTIKSKAKTELLIFLTPHIIMNTTTLMDLSTSESKKAEMIPQVYSPAKLDQFDGVAGPDYP